MFSICRQRDRRSSGTQLRRGRARLISDFTPEPLSLNLGKENFTQILQIGALTNRLSVWLGSPLFMVCSGFIHFLKLMCTLGYKLELSQIPSTVSFFLFFLVDTSPELGHLSTCEFGCDITSQGVEPRDVAF